MLQIGKYTPARNGQAVSIQREFYGQGYIVKDEAAYNANLDQVCYVPELSDDPYTHNDILALCDGQEQLARLCFDCIDWQSPSTWVEEQFSLGEWMRCPTCGRIVDCCEHTDCPYCKGGIDL